PRPEPLLHMLFGELDRTRRGQPSFLHVPSRGEERFGETRDAQRLPREELQGRRVGDRAFQNLDGLLTTALQDQGEAEIGGDPWTNGNDVRRIAVPACRLPHGERRLRLPPPK